MRIGFTLPQFGALADEAADVARFAREAERLGADSLWVGDRLLAPVEPTVGYAGGDTVPAVFNSALDPFAVMSVAAGVTERALIGTNVLNAPWYAPAVLARTLSTVDRISGGRLLPGLGTGWSPEEYLAAGVPMHERGARMDECLDVLDELWSDGPAEHEGRFWAVPTSHVEARPVQRPRPPVYLAGFAPAAERRVARRGDGWLPVHVVGAGEFDPASVNEPIARIRRLAGDAGRDPAALRMVLRVYPMAPMPADDVVAPIVRAGADTDVEHVFVELMNVAGGVDDALEFVDAVLSRARG